MGQPAAVGSGSEAAGGSETAGGSKRREVCQMEISMPAEKLASAYKTMVTIRKAEEAFQKLFLEGKVPGFIHLYLGEEAVAAGVCLDLRQDDFVTSTHRGHGHFIAKGADLKKIAAEILGKETGLCRGRGGSMHMTDVENGLYGSTGIVGGGFPPAAGLALAAKKRKTGQVAVCFCGDGSVNEGTFHESINLAAIWDLPVVFVCENNLYAQSAPQEYHQKVRDIYRRAEGYGIPGISVDGMDVFAVYDAAAAAVKRAREGGGPTLLECRTYLFSGHYVGDAKAYRYPEEMRYYQTERDCIKLFRERVSGEGLMEESELAAIDSCVEKEVGAVVAFAETSPFPSEAGLTQHVY